MILQCNCHWHSHHPSCFQGHHNRPADVTGTGCSCNVKVWPAMFPWWDYPCVVTVPSSTFLLTILPLSQHPVLYWTVLFCTVLYCTVLYCSQSYHCHSTAPPLILSWTGHPRYNWPTLLTPILLLSWPKICANKSVIHKNDIACLHLKSPALACNSSQFIAKKVMAPHRAAVKHGVRGNTKGCLALRVTRDAWHVVRREEAGHWRICASISWRMPHSMSDSNSVGWFIPFSAPCEQSGKCYIGGNLMRIANSFYCITMCV